VADYETVLRRAMERPERCPSELGPRRSADAGNAPAGSLADAAKGFDFEP
jgi:hypothetical protein